MSNETNYNDEGNTVKFPSKQEILALVLAVIPFFAHATSTSTRTVNGQVVESSYTDVVAIACGILAILVGLFSLQKLKETPDKDRLKRIGAIVGILLLGGFQTLRGFGVFYNPSASSMARPSQADITTKLIATMDASATSTPKPSPTLDAVKLSMQGLRAKQDGDIDAALEAHSKAIELKPDYTDAYIYRARIYSEQGAYEQAIADYTKAIELDPPNLTLPYMERARTYYEQGAYEQAFADYDKVIELSPGYKWAYYNRGNAYADMGNPEQAILDYSQAIELDPDISDFYFKRGLAYAYANDLEHAIADYTKAIGIAPNDAMAYNNRGYAYEKSGNLEQAIADYTKAIEIAPDFAMAYNNRGIAYERSDNPEQAFSDYSKAIEFDPNFALAYNNRGYIYARSGNLEQAIADYTKAIELNPNYAVAYLYRGVSYADSGSTELAIADLERYLELAPNAQNREKVQEMLDKLKSQSAGE